MANKRLSELNELVAANLKPGDWFYVVDTATNVLEGKKIAASNLQTFILAGGLISSSFASSSLSASYVNPSSVGLISSASYSISSSYANRAFFAITSDTSSYIDSSKVFGLITSASMASTASYLLYAGRFNGSASYSLTASRVTLSDSCSYLVYTPGFNNGIIVRSITASLAYNASASVSSSYLVYDTAASNGTASYAVNASSSLSSSYVVSCSFSDRTSYADDSYQTYVAEIAYTSSHLLYTGIPNGTASLAISSSRALMADSSSYLYYTGVSNGTASYAVNASGSLSASYAISSSRSEVTFQSVSSSYALSASYPLLDPYQYKIFGPYNTTDGTYGAQSATSCTYRNFIVAPPGGTTTTIVVEATSDVKVPITTVDTGSYTVQLYIDDYTNGVLQSSTVLDASRPVNYINSSVSGYQVQSIALKSRATPIVSGSWYTLRVEAGGGATFDGNCQLRGVTFYVYTKPDTNLTRTTYPPF